MKRIPREKKERALGEHLHVKGARCDSPKCAFTRKPYRPGVHGQKRRRQNTSDFGRQLKERQKFKAVYGITEKSLRLLTETAMKGTAGASEKLVEFLERRLDNTLFRLRFAESRFQARQLVVQGHILVNGIRVRSPGSRLNVGDVIIPKKESLAKGPFRNLKENWKKEQKDLPVWLALDPEKLEGRVIAIPQEVEHSFEPNLLVEAYSK